MLAHAPQVMLAQQRTIIQLVELVNVLHGEAAALVSKLTGQQALTATELQQQQQQLSDPQDTPDEASDRQMTADQQMAHERYEHKHGLRVQTVSICQHTDA